jgi:hypothetical protein
MVIKACSVSSISLHRNQLPQARAVIFTAPGEEAQVDYGSSLIVRDPQSGNCRRTRLFVMRLAEEQLRGLLATAGPDLANAGWEWSQKVIRTLVQRIEIARENMKIVSRVSPEGKGSKPSGESQSGAETLRENDRGDCDGRRQSRPVRSSKRMNVG